MKLLIVLCLITGAVSKDWKPLSGKEAEHLAEECLQEREYSVSAQQSIKRRAIPKTEEGDCFYRCIGIKRGIYTDAAGYNATRVASTFKKSGYKIRSRVLIRCLKNKYIGKNICFRAGANMRCLFSKEAVSLPKATKQVV